MQHSTLARMVGAPPAEDIAIPMDRIQPDKQTRARLTRHYCRTAGTTAMLNAFAEIPAPLRRWPQVLSGAIIFVCGVAMAVLVVVGW